MTFQALLKPVKTSFYIAFVTLSACMGSAEKTPKSTESTSNPSPEFVFCDYNPSPIIGDFNGDGLPDTLLPLLRQMPTNRNIESVPNPMENDWDEIVDWYYKQDISLLLTGKENGIKALDLGVAKGLLFWTNLGDNNGDGVDELAIVIDYLDYSRLNSCFIYSYCNHKWELMFDFSIHESAFDNTDFAHTDIPGYLTKRKGMWYYNDYIETLEDDKRWESKQTAMPTLRLPLQTCKNKSGKRLAQ